jgi:hypothetical protein
VFTPADGRPPAPVETVTLSIHAEETGGTPIWEEMQSVPVDTAGRYNLLLGASQTDGVPLDIFASGEARWLSIRFQRPGELDGPRARLTSVPYALHAADAQTLGGRPASAYLLAAEARGRDAGAVAAATSAAVVSPAAITTGFTNSVAKYLDNADTIGPSAMVASGDNVGIGTGSAVSVGQSAPIDRLNVRFTDNSGAITGISVRNNAGNGAAYSGMLFYDHNGALAQFQGFNNVTHEYRINNVARNAASSFDGSINFLIGSVSRLFVAANGNIGMGTTAPGRPLEIIRNGFADAAFVSYSSNGGAFVDGRTARGTAASPSAVEAGDVLISFGGAGYDSTNFVRNVSIDFIAAGDWSTTSRPTDIRFSTAPADFPVFFERMRITDDGNVGIGTTDPGDRLHVNGEARVANCVRRLDGTGIAGTCPSDQRFKRDITPFGATLQAVAALRPVHYYWRAGEFPQQHFGGGRTYGLIAQEVEDVLPELVVTHADGYKAVDYSKLPLLTVQAIKELQAQNDSLQSRIAELERLVKQLLPARSRH